MLKLGKRLGSIGGTIVLGKGTVRNEILNVLGLSEVRKEIFLAIIDQEMEESFFEEMSKKLHLNKPNQGIAFSMPLNRIIEIGKAKATESIVDLRENQQVSNRKNEGVTKVDYEAIFVIVNKGLSENVLNAANSAGSTGGTVIHGRGSGTQEKEKLFDIEIEPEKDMILILAQAKKAKAIAQAIKEELEICQPGRGIIFVLDVNNTLGIYKGE